eukprot:806727-Rhodomonas_salina.1
MAARDEGAVLITKEHVRCLLKYANILPRFWTYYMMHFCWVYNHWPDRTSVSPWSLMDKSNFSYSIDSDIVMFGCYAAGHLAKEHPLVKDKTLLDRAIEGAFLGWDKSTPQAWIDSFKHQRPMLLPDCKFLQHLLPFKDPSCLVNTGDLTDEQ